jgi:dihydrofolate reductase
MGRIGVHEFTTVDGVIGAPMWTMDYSFDPRMGEAIGALMTGSSAILFGRVTYQEFAPAWSARTAEEDPGAPFMNDTPKYVVSGTLTDDAADWAPSTVLGAYDAAVIRRFKDGIDGGIYVSGSGTLARAMLADGLVDELHLYVYPIALGTGPRLFPDGAPRTPLALVDSDRYDNGVVRLTYAPAAA